MYTEALKSQGRVLLALMLREARTRYGRRQVGYLWAFITPIVQITLMYYLMKYLGRRSNPLDDNDAMFLATGMLTFVGFRNVLNRTKGGYGSNEALLSFPIVKLMDVFLGRALLELATWFTVSFSIILGLILLGMGYIPRNPLVMLSAVLALFSIAFGLGMCIAMLNTFVPASTSFTQRPTRMLFFISGVFFLPELLPTPLKDILAWNPILHGITQFRMGYYRLYDSPMLDTDYLYGWAICSLLAAFTIERVARKPIRNLT